VSVAKLTDVDRKYIPVKSPGLAPTSLDFEFMDVTDGFGNFEKRFPCLENLLSLYRGHVGLVRPCLIQVLFTVFQQQIVCLAQFFSLAVIMGI
jgi:hypothetical protein